MAATQGVVIETSYAGRQLDVAILSNGSIVSFFVVFDPTDGRPLRDIKSMLVEALETAHASGQRVSVTHPTGSGEIRSVTVLRRDISPLGPAIHGDFYAITGNEIPDDVEIVFETTTQTIRVTPELVRPHWVFLSRLPGGLLPGRATVRLQSPSWTSDTVPIDVSTGPRLRVRTLYSGAPKPDPYTIAFVANPAIQLEGSTTIAADPVLQNRAGYHRAVRDSLRNLLTTTEDLLRRGGRDRGLRFVSVFDETRDPVVDTSLAYQVSPNRMATHELQLARFLSSYRVIADIVFVMHNSTTHDLATANYSRDDSTRPGTTVTYDGISRTHGHFSLVPGSAAIAVTWDTTGLTVLHEFGHAASDWDNGMVADLYVDDLRPGFVVNKKTRAAATAPIPNGFCDYDNTTYDADPLRNGIGYPADWLSYHCELIDAAHPNVMDNYYLSNDIHACRLDTLSSAWLHDRLNVKMNR